MTQYGYTLNNEAHLVQFCAECTLILIVSPDYQMNNDERMLALDLYCHSVNNSAYWCPAQNIE